MEAAQSFDMLASNHDATSTTTQKATNFNFTAEKARNPAFLIMLHSDRQRSWKG
jgi:hypothetical protein